MPTTAIATFGAGRVDPLKDPRDADIEVVNLKVSTSFAAGTVLGEITASPGVYGPYASGNSDGTQNPTHILQYQCVTDASGNVTFGAGPAGTSEWGRTEKGAPAYRSGEFSERAHEARPAGAGHRVCWPRVGLRAVRTADIERS
jgi:hypothetical protein